MEPNVAAVNPRRRYDASRRRHQAQQTRLQILDAARKLLTADGYAATTIAGIAAAADVSVETVYKAFGGKAGLVRAIWEQGLAGAGPTPAWERSDAMRVRQADPREIIRNWGQLTTEVAPRVAPILLLIRTAAASDPDMGSLQREIVEQRLERMLVNARHLHARGYLRRGVSLAEARDVLWLYSSPELYELLVLTQGWSIERYGRFVADAMIAALLPS